jgi:Phosphate-selective porin O and P
VTLRKLLPLTLLLAAQVRAQGAAPATPPRAGPPPASSSAEELEALKKELAELKARVEGDGVTRGEVQGVQADLDNFKYQYQRDRETKSALSTRNLLISGIVQARGAYYDSNITSPLDKRIASTSVNNPTLLDDRRTTFDIPAAILAFNGLLYRDYEQARNLGFTLSASSSPTAGTNNAFFNVLDANLAYQLLPTIENDGPRLSLTLGQQLVPFGLESNTTEEFKPVINNAQFVGQAGLGARQIGLIARGEFFTQFDFGYSYRQALLAVALGVVNGTGPNRDDDNAFKDVVARVAITVPAEYNSWLRELRIGASAYLGRASLNNGAATPALVATGLKNRLGVDVYYNHFPFGFTYEAVRSVDDAWESGREVRHNGLGQTLTGFYSFGEQFLRSIKTQGKFDDWWPVTWQPFVRYDRWAADLKKQGAANEIYTTGLNVFFAETTKAQINVNRRIQHVGGGDNVASTELLAQVQFGF